MRCGIRNQNPMDQPFERIWMYMCNWDANCAQYSVTKHGEQTNTHRNRERIISNRKKDVLFVETIINEEFEQQNSVSRQQQPNTILIRMTLSIHH